MDIEYLIYQIDNKQKFQPRRSNIRQGGRERPRLARSIQEAQNIAKHRSSHSFFRRLLWVPEILSSVFNVFNKVLSVFLFFFSVFYRISLYYLLRYLIFCLLSLLDNFQDLYLWPGGPRYSKRQKVGLFIWTWFSSTLSNVFLMFLDLIYQQPFKHISIYNLHVEPRTTCFIKYSC